jgi:hypothetical protein
MRPIKSDHVLRGCSFCSRLRSQMGDESARTPVTGSAGGATSQMPMQTRTLHQSLGLWRSSKTRRRPGIPATREYKLTSTVRLFGAVQQSNRFVVERAAHLARCNRACLESGG